ncbi:uncharacterized protein LOC129754682 [Uranotaenia lowii]|uniref:uncharacterized protein LOC129754681 n=1 Tax=Uranotaenia lowii TaxID=190385 RepID=UPI0024791344|nr:uncharacterized protein LOC129754681 [Uranotaenia lowii]XP_055606856.1 uncharacterized protein LOC129754682 [Uranotaenia lowii]
MTNCRPEVIAMCTKSDTVCRSWVNDKTSLQRGKGGTRLPLHAEVTLRSRSEVWFPCRMTAETRSVRFLSCSGVMWLASHSGKESKFSNGQKSWKRSAGSISGGAKVDQRNCDRSGTPDATIKERILCAFSIASVDRNPMPVGEQSERKDQLKKFSERRRNRLAPLTRTRRATHPTKKQQHVSHAYFYALQGQ